MNCSRHFLMFRWERHAWRRRVTATDRRTFTDMNMWGRPVPSPQVICHAEYVCDRCGATRDEGDCGCDAERGNQCPARLALLAELRAKGA